MALWRPFCLFYDRHLCIYRLSNIMFASHRGVYMKILHGCYQNHESATILLTIILFFSFHKWRPSWILPIMTYLKYFQTNPLCRAYLKTLWWKLKLCFYVLSVENDVNL